MTLNYRAILSVLLSTAAGAAVGNFLMAHNAAIAAALTLATALLHLVQDARVKS
jgi:hypothetical protein